MEAAHPQGYELRRRVTADVASFSAEKCKREGLSRDDADGVSGVRAALRILAAHSGGGLVRRVYVCVAWGSVLQRADRKRGAACDDRGQRAVAERAAYLPLPISAYLFGSFLSEWMGKSVKRLNLLRWDTILVALEVVMVVFLALMPPSWPDQVCQVTLNFACAMQFNTYRQVEGVPAATTFVTNHIRQIGSNLAKLARHPEDDALRSRVRTHGSLLGFFLVGVVTSTVMCRLFSYASLLGALVPLGVVLAGLVRADLFLERGKLDAVPHGR